MCQDDLKGRCSCLGLWVEDGVLGLEEGDRGGEDERKEGRGRVVREGRVAVARTWDRSGWERCERERGVGREGLGLGCSRSRAGPGRSGGSQGRLGLGADRDLGRRRKEGMARPVLGRRKKKKSRLGGGRKMN